MAYEKKGKSYGSDTRKGTGGRPAGPGAKKTAFEYGKKKDSNKPYSGKSTSGKPTSGRSYEGKENTGRGYGKGPVKDEKTIGKSFKDRELKPREERYLKKKMGFVEETDEAEDNINLIEGRNPVLEALKSGREMDKIFVQKGANEGSIRQIIAIAREKNILIKEVDKAKLDGLSQTKAHQGVIASAALYKYYEVDEILQIAADKGEDPFIILLDEITDNNNLGSIMRTAEAAGVHGIVIPKRRSVGLTPVVAKTSAGAIEYVPVSKVTNISQTIEYLKKKGIWVVGADMSGETYYKKDLTGPMALVIGSEGEGMGRLVKERCDFLVKVPMTGKIASLNAAVSTGIIVYEINKQRTIKKQ